MGIGISLALLIYLFQNAMNGAASSSSYSSPSSEAGYGDTRRYGYLQRYKVRLQ